MNNLATAKITIITNQSSRVNGVEFDTTTYEFFAPKPEAQSVSDFKADKLNEFDNLSSMGEDILSSKFEWNWDRK